MCVVLWAAFGVDWMSMGVAADGELVWGGTCCSLLVEVVEGWEVVG